MQIAIKDITVGKRYRQKVGDLADLKASMGRLGLLQPIGIDKDKRLIFGQRRVEAARQLGWAVIECRVVDLEDPLAAERDENECRADFTPSEKVAIGKAIEEREKEKAKERQRQHAGTAPGRGKNGDSPGKFPEVLPDNGRATDKVAEAVGWSGKTYEKAKEVVDEGTPQDVAKMDATGKVNGVHQDMQARKAPPKPPAPPKILCKRCQRVGAVAGCTNCKMAREAARASANGDGKGDAHEGEAKEPKVALMDQLGNPVPKGLRDTFVGCRESLDSGVKLLQEVRRTVKGLSKWNAWMRPTDMETKLAELIEDLKNGLPYSVCQDCSGKGCKVCRQEGWLTKWRAEELAAK